MVFGNAVAVPVLDLVVLAAVAALCAGAHALFAKELVFVSFDPETAAALGFDTRRWDALLFGTLGLAIPVAARALGALPVFAFLTIPAAAALLLARRLRVAFALAGAIGLVAAAGGYLVSWFWQIPTGATMVALAGLSVLPGALRSRAT
jgi:zinc transport system permease protein